MRPRAGARRGVCQGPRRPGGRPRGRPPRRGQGLPGGTASSLPHRRARPPAAPGGPRAPGGGVGARPRVCPPSLGVPLPDVRRGASNSNQPCNHHDGCYAGFPRNGKPTYWATRKQCDEWFLGDMVASCKVTHGKNWGKTGAAKECNSKAYLYRQGVRERGKPFYKGPKSKNG